MNTALEQVKRAELNAEHLLSKANEKSFAIKKDTTDKLKAMEDKYYEDLKQLQLNQKEKESTILAAQMSSLDVQRYAEKDELNNYVHVLKQDLVCELIRKVIGAYGDSKG